MTPRTLVVPALVAPAVLAAVVWAARAPLKMDEPAAMETRQYDVSSIATQVDRKLTARWTEEKIDSAVAEDELQVLRRLSLSLHGTIPSLEEIRQFERDRSPNRILRWTGKLLEDSRFADYFAERLARAYVGVDTAPFLVFRRDRFTNWLSEKLNVNAPYDEMVRQILSEEGLWTGNPATNFVTSAVIDGDVDENKLAGRSVRVLLGQRMDCAQCHNHPYASWKQEQFEGVAAYFGQSRLTIGGVEDLAVQKGQPVEYRIEDRTTLQEREIAPAVPFHPEWLPSEGTRRQRLAHWITHPDNRRFDRAIVNRVWGYLFGRPWIDPVDDLPDPPEPGDETVLDLIANDFQANGRDIRRLVLIITSTRAFRLSSKHPALDEETYELAKKHWAVFPMTRLRPEQVIGSMLQASSVQTIDQNSHVLTRILRFFRERNFVEEYGDLGEAELTEQVSTIPQALQRMNSQLSREIVQSNPLNATGRIAAMSADAAGALENCFLIAFTRRPTSEEAVELTSQLASENRETRLRAVEDILWALFNSEEFSWNH